MAEIPGSLRLRKLKTKENETNARLTGKGETQSQSEAEADECPVSPTGRLFLHDDFYTVILCALEFSQSMELSHLRKVLGSSIALHPRFHSRVDGLGPKSRGPPVWVPVEIDINWHVREAHVDKPEKTLTTYMGNMASLPPFDPFKPLWEAYLLHFPSTSTPSACIFRIHHALGDGTSLMSLLLSCARQTQNPQLLPTLPGTSRPRVAASLSLPSTSATDNNNKASESAASDPHMPSEESSETLEAMAFSEGLHAKLQPAKGGEKGSRKGFFVRRTLWEGGAVAWNTLSHMCRFVGAVTVMPDSTTPLKASTDLSRSPKGLVVTPPLSLADISVIRKAFHATVNDVMITLLSLALEQYLERHSGVLSIPKRPRVTAVGLVNLRKSPGLKELSDLMAEGWQSKSNKEHPWGNCMGTYLLPLPISPFSTASQGKGGKGGRRSNHAVDTLLAVKRMCDSKKLSLEAHCTYLSGEIVMRTMGAKAASFLLGRLTSQTTLSVSNMLGPVEEISLGGVPISGIMPTAPPPNHALCCHFQSYNGQLRVVIYACLATIPDPNELSLCFMDAFEKLKLSVC